MPRRLYLLNIYYQVDLTPPSVENVMIWDGNGLNDVEYQHDNMTVFTRWHGFYDAESYVTQYVISVGTSPRTNNVIEKLSTSVDNRLKIKLNNTLNHGNI